MRSLRTLDGPPRLVLFDLDDTLVDHTGAVAGAMRTMRRQFPGLRPLSVPELVKLYNAHLRSVHRAIVRGELSPEDARVERLASLFDAAGTPSSLPEIRRASRAYRSLYRASRRRIPGSLGLLRHVRVEALVGILTNNREDEQRSKLREFGFAPLVDFMVTSEGEPWSKPDPRAFRRAMEVAGADALCTTMVGDSWADDIEGAVGAGLRAVWFNRWGDPFPRPHRGVRMLRSFLPLTVACHAVLAR